jgi:hypothetical protein
MRISGVKFGKQALENRKEKLRAGGWPISKWITFCERMHELGFETIVYEAKSTRSKYVTVKRGNKIFKIRFSNHMPAYSAQVASDSDFYVGVSHSGVTTTSDAERVVLKYFEGGQKF